MRAHPIAADEARAAARQEPYDQLMALYPGRGGSRRFGPNLQQRRLGGRRLRQRHALRGLAGQRRDRQGAAEFRNARPALIACWRAGEGLFTVDMGAPRFRWDEIPLAQRMPDTRAIDLQFGPPGAPILRSPSAVNMGNPHAIFWVDDPQAYDLRRIGPQLEHHRCFPSAPTSRWPRRPRAITS